MTTTQTTNCEACDERPISLRNTNDLCDACDNRNLALMLTQSALEELKSIERKLNAQEDFFTNATDWEISQSRRTIKRLTEAHDCLEDAGERAGYGLEGK